MTSDIATNTRYYRSRQPLSLIVADQLRHLIYSGQLTPGQRLMSETQLAQHFECSRSSIREAIHSLRVRGLLEVRRGKGTFVSVPTVSDIKNDFLVMARHVGQRNGELAALRTWLANRLVAAACQAPPEERAVLRKHVVSAEKSPTENAETEINWYQVLGAMARQPFSSMVLEIVLTVAQDQRAEAYKSPQELERSRRVYLAMNDAIAQCDNATAR